MANWREPTDEQLSLWAAWVAGRPTKLRALLLEREFTPWKLYRLKSSGHRVEIVAFNEHADGTVSVRVNVGGKFNHVAFERSVFGIAPEDLEECDLPGPHELLGSRGLTIDQARAEMAARGKA